MGLISGFFTVLKPCTALWEAQGLTMDLCSAQANHVIRSLVVSPRGTPGNGIYLGCLHFTKAICELSDPFKLVFITATCKPAERLGGPFR